MDWTVILSATYAFVLALVLLLIFLRSYRKTKEKYVALLEEKEQRISRIQLDVEDTMKALEDYADEVHRDWDGLRSSSHDDYLDMQEQTVKLGASFVELQSQISSLSMRLTRIESRLDDMEDYLDGLKSAKAPDRAEEAPVVDEELEEALKKLAYQPDGYLRPALDAEADSEQTPISFSAIKEQKDEELRRVDELSTRTEEALKMLRAGRNILDTAKDLGFSRGELELLSTRYRLSGNSK